MDLAWAFKGKPAEVEGSRFPAARGQTAGLGRGLQVASPCQGRELLPMSVTGTGDAVFLLLALSTMGAPPQPELETQN